MYSYRPPHLAEQKPEDQLEHTYSSSVRIRDGALKTCQRRWTIGKSDERGSGISVLAAWHDDMMVIYIYIYIYIRICVCLCIYIHIYLYIYVSIYRQIYIYIYLYIYIHPYTYTYICMCVCVCMCKKNQCKRR